MRRIPPRTVERQLYDLECSIEATDTLPERRVVLRNLSQAGARLEGPELEGCPDEFELRIVHASGAVERLYAQCVWRQPDSVGIRFVETVAASRRRMQHFSRAS